MAHSQFARLPDRTVLSVRGPDARKLLQDLVTDNLEDMQAHGDIRHSGLLSPQGKILFEFFIVRWDRGSEPVWCIDCETSQADDLLKRLAFYKLRAKVEISRSEPELVVAAVWGGAPPQLNEGAVLACKDPRLDAMGFRLLAPRNKMDDLAKMAEGDVAALEPAAVDNYHAHRISCGVPEGGRDFSFGDAFPHEALWDEMGSVDFRKGCFIGQEVVSRMEHRGTARKRIVKVTAASALETGNAVQAGQAAIGNIGSVSGNSGLALVRLDRVAEARAKAIPITVADRELSIELPEWVSFSMADFAPKT